MESRTCTIRGAITIEENTKCSILENTELMLKNILEKNNIDISNIISIIFTATKDIDAVYPAVAARNLGITDASLLCVQEMFVEGSLNMCIRTIVTIISDKKQEDMKHIYLKDAKKLRPDISNTKNTVSVAIDGPAGSGKSTAAKLAAKEMGYIYIDTGAMYRATALFCIKNNIDTSNIEAVETVLPKIKIEFKNNLDKQEIYLNDINVTNDIRTPEISKAASDVAALKCVREKLVLLQKGFAEKYNVIMDGRDIATCVIPNANVKIYMEADITERARRRCDELKQNGHDFDFEKIKQDIANRDENDKKRETSPLKMANDAILIDTTNLSIEEVKDKILYLIQKSVK